MKVVYPNENYPFLHFNEKMEQVRNKRKSDLMLEKIKINVLKRKIGK